MIFNQNSTAVLFATFVDYKGEAATISGTPTISIYHVNNGNVTTDVNAQDMTQLTGSTYYYEYYIGTAADKTNYVARFSAVYSDGTNALGEETFQVTDRRFFEPRRGGSTIRNILGDQIWTKEEKDKIVKSMSSINDILVMAVSINKSLMQIDKRNTKKIDMSQDLITKLSDNVNKIKSDMSDDDARDHINNIKTQLNDMKAKLDAPEDTSQYDDISSKMQSVESVVGDISKLLVKIIPSKEIEGMLDES